MKNKKNTISVQVYGITVTTEVSKHESHLLAADKLMKRMERQAS